MDVGRALMIGGAVAGGGVAGGLLMRNVFEGVGERRWDKAFEHRQERIATNQAERNGAMTTPFPYSYTIDPARGESDNMFDAVMAVMPLFGAGGLGALGASQLAKGGGSGIAIGLAAFAGAGALVGGVVGGIWGESRGASAAGLDFGLDVTAQAREAFDNFDRDGDGVIMLRASGGEDGSLSEHLRRSGSNENGVPNYISARDELVRADANGDSQVTLEEVRAHIARYDEDGDGTILRQELYDRQSGLASDVLLNHIAPDGRLP